MSKKAKLIRTQYHNYWTNEIEDEKPYGVLGDDYWVLRKGMVFNVYSEPDEVKKICDDLDIPNDYEVICVHDNGTWFGFGTNYDFNRCNYFEVIEK